MGAARLVSTNTGLGHASTRLPARKAMRVGRGERSAKRLRVTIVLALFISLVATALLVGRAVIAPVLTTGTGGRGGAGWAKSSIRCPMVRSAGGFRSTTTRRHLSKAPSSNVLPTFQECARVATGILPGAPVSWPVRASLVILWIGAWRIGIKASTTDELAATVRRRGGRPARKGNKPYGYHASRAPAGVARRRTSDRHPRSICPGCYG